VILGKNGFGLGEWFCSTYDPNQHSTHQKSLEELNRIRGVLDRATLYGGYGTNGMLKEQSLLKLPPLK